MSLTAYWPLQSVYAFHAPAEAWLLRRYASAVTVDAEAEPRMGPYAESRVQVFRDPRDSRGGQSDQGQQSADRCVVYTLQPLRGIDSQDPAVPVFHDVLFDVAGVTGNAGGAWVVAEVRGWRDALGYETVLLRQGQRGLPPWV